MTCFWVWHVIPAGRVSAALACGNRLAPCGGSATRGDPPESLAPEGLYEYYSYKCSNMSLSGGSGWVGMVGGIRHGSWRQAMCRQALTPIPAAPLTLPGGVTVRVTTWRPDWRTLWRGRRVGTWLLP